MNELWIETREKVLHDRIKFQVILIGLGSVLLDSIRFCTFYSAG